MKDYEEAWYERKKKDIRNSTYYKAIRNYILRTYGENENIPLDFRGRMRIAHLATERYSIQERAPYGMDDCFDQVIIDLINEGIIRHEHSLGREWYVKLTEKEVKPRKMINEKEKSNLENKAHISRRKKKEMKKNKQKAISTGGTER